MHWCNNERERDWNVGYIRHTTCFNFELEKSKHYLLVVVGSRMNPFSFGHHNPTEKGTLTIIFILKKDMWTGIRRVLYAVHIALAIPEIDRHMF